MDGFKEGYDFAKRVGSFHYSSAVAESYIDDINNEISLLINSLYETADAKPNQAAKILGGDIAEVWHAGTFNINAAVKRSMDHATADQINTLGSADVRLDSGLEYSLKYYATPKLSAQAQAVSAFEEYRRNGGKRSLDEYLELHPELTKEQALGSALYNDQIRLIPEDQLEEAKSWLKRKALEEAYRGDGQDIRYQNALDMIAESEGHAVIDNGKGVKSIPLTKKGSTELAQLAKDNNIDPETWGLSPHQLITFEDFLKGSFRSGTSAALINMVIKIAPDIYKALDYLIKTGRIDKEDLYETGLKACRGAAQGFFIGSISYAVVTACKSGLWGEAATTVNPHFIGTFALIVYDTINNGIKVAQGKMTAYDMANTFVSESIIGIFSLAGGTIVSAYFGPFGYLLGSLIGSVIGGISYSAGKHILISLCIDSGFTAFGLVKQNYQLPDKVLRNMLGSVFRPDEFEYEEFLIENQGFEIESFSPDKFEFETISFQLLRRGLINVSTVGYALQ